MSAALHGKVPPRGGRARVRGIAVLVAAALTLAAAPPCFAAAPALDPSPQLVYRPPVAEQAVAQQRPQRALLEFTAVLLYENLRYWSENSFVEDWQFRLGWDDQKRKYLELEGLRFDSNAFPVNWSHAGAGGIYYSLGRVNNLGVKDSLLLAAFETIYWEGIVEWREVFSVNDTVTTLFGALSTGEPWYQIARYFSTRESPVARVFGLMHPLLGIHSLLDPASRPRPTDEQTLPGYGAVLSLGAAATDSRYPSDTGIFTAVGLRSRLALAPGFTAPGTESRAGWEVLSSTFNVRVDVGAGAIRELDASSGAVLYGRVDRNVRGDSRGSGSILGLGTAFALFRKASVTVYDSGDVKVRQGYDLRLEEPRDFRDKYSIMHLVGPVYEGFWRGGVLGVTWGLEAYPDFALVNAYALNAYSADHDISGAKTTLVYYGYYYGYGASIKARLSASAGPVTLDTAASIHYHESIEGLDRFESELAGDPHASDTWYRFEVTLGVLVPGTPLALEGGARWSNRRGVIGDTVVRGNESRYSLGITWRL